MKTELQKLNLEVEGQQITGVALKMGTEIWISVNGKTFVTQSRSQATQRKRRTSTDMGSVCAPMPGKITNLKIVEGDLVEIGQILVVMEAMKMEYSLKSPRVGRVKRVLSQVGDQVKLGQELVEVE